MALSDDFKEAVLQNKKTKVRIMMKDSLLMDSTGATFDEMANYAAKPGFMSFLSSILKAIFFLYDVFRS